MDDPILIEAALADALQLSADAPSAWVDAAVLIPSMLGEISEIERLTSDPGFRARFRDDPPAALATAGLTPSAPVLAALRERLGS
jgi:hypothetical protein